MKSTTKEKLESYLIEKVKKWSGREAVYLDHNRGGGLIVYLDFSNDTYLSVSQYGGYYIWENNNKRLHTESLKEALSHVKEILF